MKRYLLYSLVLGLLSVVGLTQAKIIYQEDVRYDYYPVEGKTYHDLLRSLKEKGPQGHHALTSWHIDWSYGYKARFGQCRLIDIDVGKNIIVRLPLWMNRPTQSSRLTREWDRYLKALTFHEEQHIANAVKAQEAIKKTLVALPPMRGCVLMGKTANKQARTILNKAIASDKRLDKQTGHGKTDGASFKENNTFRTYEKNS